MRINLALLFAVVLSACGADKAADNAAPEQSGLTAKQASTTPTADADNRLAVLVDVTWLDQRTQDPDIVVIEFADSKASYVEGHISGARYLDWRTDIIDSSQTAYYSLMPEAAYESLLSSIGVTPDSTVILYDELNSRAAIRFFWTMKYYGHRDVRILDGGKPKWVANGLGLSQLEPEVEPTQYEVTDINHDLLVDRAGVERALRDASHVLVDGRPFDQYSGEAEGKVFHTDVPHNRLGHIYGAKSVPWAENFNADGTFKSTSELQTIYQARHIEPHSTVVAYCNEGLHAAVPWFVLSQLLGYAKVTLYDNSMAEWGNSEETPMVVGKHCM